MEPATYSISQEDHVAFSVMHFYGSFAQFVLVMGLVVVAVTAVLLALFEWTSAYSVIIGGAVGMAVMFVLTRFVTVPRHAKKSWRDFALLREPVELTLSQEGFSMVQPSAEVTAKWDDMIVWNESEHVFAIYITQQQAYILPKQQIPASHIDFARERLIESGLVKKRKRRK